MFAALFIEYGADACYHIVTGKANSKKEADIMAFAVTLFCGAAFIMCAAAAIGTVVLMRNENSEN